MMKITLLMWSDRVGVMFEHNGKHRHLSVLAPEMFGKGDSSHEYNEDECTTWLAQLGFTTLGTSAMREVETIMMSTDVFDGEAIFFFTLNGVDYHIRGRGAEISVTP